NAEDTVKIGRKYSAASNNFSGYIDEVVVFDYALSTTQVGDLYNGRYNLDDRIVLPGADLIYQVTAQNNLISRGVRGYFFAEPEGDTSPLIVDTDFQAFHLDRLESGTLNGTVVVTSTASAGVYDLDLVAEGVITAEDESDFFLTLPDPDVGLYFENNHFPDDTSDSLAAAPASGVVAECPALDRLGDETGCPALLEDGGVFGRGLEFDGTDDTLLVRATSDNSGLNFEDAAFTIAAWISPTHDEAETAKRTVLGYYEPDRLWFDLDEETGATEFYDQAGEFKATCDGSECPTKVGASGQLFDGSNDELTIASNEYIDDADLDRYSILIDYAIDTGNTNDIQVIYEQGSSDRGLSIFVYTDYAGYPDKWLLFVCNWDTSEKSNEAACIDNIAETGTHYERGGRLIVTLDTSANEMKAYLDNVYLGTAETLLKKAHASEIGIGSDNGGFRTETFALVRNARLQGSISTLAFFQHTLSADEITFYNYFVDAGNYNPGEVFPILYVEGDDRLGMAFIEKNAMRDYSKGVDLILNDWNHVALTYDGLYTATLYLNGDEVRTQYLSEGMRLSFVSSSTQFHVGPEYPQFRVGWAGGEYGHFQGVIDSVIFYDGALDADEVANLASSAFNESAHLFFELDEVPGSTQFQYGYASDDVATCTPLSSPLAGGTGGGCPAAGMRGVINQAAYFDGVDDQIEAEPALDGDTEKLSLAAWVYPTSGNAGAILEYGGSDAVYLFTDHISVYDGKSTHELSFSLPEDEWTHLVATYDADDGLKVYFNGVEQVSKDISGYSINLSAMTHFIMGNTLNGVDPLTGYLDDVRFYDIALSPGQAAALYQQSAPQVRFRFDEDAGDTQVWDSSINAYTGTLDATSSENVQLGVEGRLGNAVRFYAPEDSSLKTRIVVTDALANLTKDFTVMMWVKPSITETVSSDGKETLLHWPGVRLTQEEDGKLRLNDAYTSQAPAIEKGEWNHIVVSVSPNKLVRFYLNGELHLTDAYSDTTTWSAGGLSIGELFYDDNYGLTNSTLDELVIYSRALSLLEIEDIYRVERRWYRRVETFRIAVDTDTPTVTLKSNVTYRPNTDVILDVSTRDTTAQVQLVDFGVKSPTAGDYAWQSTPACLDAVEPGVAWCPTFDPTTSEGEGCYDLQFRAVDVVGNETTSSVYTTCVDGTPPTITVSALNIGGWHTVTQAGDTLWTLPLSGTVSDPTLENDNSDGSGLVTDTVRVVLLDRNGDPAARGYQLATVDGTTWDVDYVLAGMRPTGLYTVVASAEDWVGNSSSVTFGAIRLDTTAPNVDLHTWLLPQDNTLTATHALSGTVVDLPRTMGAVLKLHFDENNGSDTYYDTSGEDNHATCITCPTETTGVFGQALQLDGSDDYVTVTHTINPTGTNFSAMAWFSVTNYSSSRPILAQKNGTGSAGRTWLGVNTSGKLFTNLGGSSLAGTQTINTGQWYHAAVSYDGTTLKLYQDG
ncbi:MAG: LamG-like jellyroll fold domain-containing protein, partial [Anaerolineae bacterium]